MPEGKRELGLAYQVGGVETAVPPVCIDGRFGSMKSVAKHLGELLENKEAPFPQPALATEYTCFNRLTRVARIGAAHVQVRQERGAQGRL